MSLLKMLSEKRKNHADEFSLKMTLFLSCPCLRGGDKVRKNDVIVFVRQVPNCNRNLKTIRKDDTSELNRKMFLKYPIVVLKKLDKL